MSFGNKEIEAKERRDGISNFQPWARNNTTCAAAAVSSETHRLSHWGILLPSSGNTWITSVIVGQWTRAKPSQKHETSWRGRGRKKRNLRCQSANNVCKLKPVLQTAGLQRKFKATVRTVSELPKLFKMCNLLAAWKLTWNSQSRFESHFWFWINKNYFSMTH